jgi:diguanylate cyclase (GGDEF)-like protein
MFDSYVQLAEGLLGELSGICLFDGRWRVRGSAGGMAASAVDSWIQTLGWNGTAARLPTAACLFKGHWLTAIPLEQSDSTLLGAFCIQQPIAYLPITPPRHAAEIARRLKPLLDCVHRELAAAAPVRERIQTLTERTAELEWLFKVTANLKDTADDRHAIEQLLAAATERLDSAMGVFAIPEKRLYLEHQRKPAAASGAADPSAAEPGWSENRSLLGVWQQTSEHLLNWAQRRSRPLVVNGAGRGSDKIPRCKILSVPVVRESGRVLGVLAFYNPPFAPDYASRHVYLARHLGRQAAAFVDMQFDLMTGLYTRGGLDRMVGVLADESQPAAGCVIYLDVDHMHVLNELHGFELGNELIVRIADLLAPPLLPEDALAARISGDRFVIVLPRTVPQAGAAVAARIGAAARALCIGTAEQSMEVSVSCGVADLPPAAQALDGAISAAELACKSAKNRGRNRVELHALDDRATRQRHADAVSVGRLRAALKSERLLLYAQRIAPLKDPARSGGYEVLLRLRAEDGGIEAPVTLLGAARRYRLLPSVDRWMAQRGLQSLSAYRGLLKSTGVSFSMNVSGQSIGDAAFVEGFAAQMKQAGLPLGCVIVELAEQSAAEHFAEAHQMIRRLKSAGCTFGLDAFGMGANSLAYVKSLHISRVRIDAGIVNGGHREAVTRAALRAVIEFAQGLGLETVAASVDDARTLALVRSLGADYAQGDAVGAPEPLDGLLKGLGADESRRMRRLSLDT